MRAWPLALVALAACGAEGAGGAPVLAPSLQSAEPAPAAGAAARSGSPGADDTTLLSPPGGGFSVRIPGAPEENEVASAPLTTHVFESETKGGVVYTVAYTDYPDDFPAASDPDRLLDTARDALVESQGGTLTFEAKTTLGASTPGRELTLRDGDRAVSARLYAAGLRVFELSVAAPETVDIGEARAAFFESFSLASR